MTSPDYAHHFSARNIPFGIASSDSHPKPQAVTRLGNSVIFLNDAHISGDLFGGVDGLPQGVFANDTLNNFAALPKSIHRRVREVIQSACVNGTLDAAKLPSGSVEDITQVQMHMPVTVSDFAGMYKPLPPSPLALQTSVSNNTRFLLLPDTRQKRRPHHYQRRPPAPCLLQLPHRIPGASQLCCGVWN